ncbi:CoA pyrophosphatase [Simiduia litorea]|uniref:CoA pyrophosphatase n=1 Tax=Simiduia litorea TaxID=1435348 RepID=UPI0036F3D913
MLKQLSSAIQQFDYALDGPGAYSKQAAVLMAITDEAAPQVVLTLRSSELKRHSGEVSFPGGWWDATDKSLVHTALREAQEEIDLCPTKVELLGNWRSRYARGGVRVQPVIGVIAPDIVLTPNPGELEAVFKVPLAFFLQDRRARTDVFTHEGKEHWVPAYEFEGFEIWGFTAGIIIDVLNSTLGAGIAKAHDSAPLRHY